MSIIPKIIHQIWIGPISPPTNLLRTWKEKHPDFEYILWNEAEIARRELTLECCRQFDMMGELAGKADILRWEILWHYGGYFIDADSTCIEPFDDFFDNRVAFATYENENVRTGLVANGTMGFVPKYRMLRDIIDWIKGTSEAAKLIKETRAWYSVGPALLTKMLNTGKYPDFAVYPSYTFLPIHFTGVSYTGHKKVYAHQEWGTANGSHATLNSVILPKELTEPSKEDWYSVLITSYNTDPSYMKECMDSIRNQTGYFGIELIWIDDGSSKENSSCIISLLENFRKGSRFTRYVYKKLDVNQGPAKASNIGLDLCSSELVFKMDSDDIMMPDRMERQIAFMSENPDIVLCGTNMKMFSIDGKKNEKQVIGETRHLQTMTWNLLCNTHNAWYMNNPTICYRKSAIISVGGYRINDPRIFYLCEDYDLLARVLRQFDKIYCIPDMLLLYRIHPGQLTHNLNDQSIENIKLRKECIENATKKISNDRIVFQ